MIIALGDSITYGQHLPVGDVPWPKLVLGHGLVAAGIPSDTTRLGLERFPEDVQGFNPKGVIIQFGHNDANRWDSDRGLSRVSPKAYAANLEEMVERCRAFDAMPFLCTLTPSHRNERHAADVSDYDEILRGVATNLLVDLIDVRTIFMSGNKEDEAELLLEDGLHLSAMGHRFYAGAVQRVLDAHWDR